MKTHPDTEDVRVRIGREKKKRKKIKSEGDVETEVEMTQKKENGTEKETNVKGTVYLNERLTSRINSMRTKTKENHKLYGYSFVLAHSELIRLVKLSCKYTVH